jgi:arylsulfatase A-like enzyme
MSKQPNILLTTTDTQRWDTLRCMGSPFAHSPNLDAKERLNQVCRAVDQLG